MRHLSMRSANPVLNSKTFSSSGTYKNTMTIDGTVNRTAISLFILSAGAYWSWGNYNSTFMMIGAVGSIILALATIFKPQWAPTTVPAYSLVRSTSWKLICSFENMYRG